MIQIGSFEIPMGMFNDGTFHLVDLPFTKPDEFIPKEGIPTIIWQYEDIREQIVLQNLVWHLRDVFQIQDINLYMPYVPNARMDRTEQAMTEVHTLKWFAKVINDLHFNKVIILDVHSSVARTLLDRVIERPVWPLIANAIYYSGAKVLVFPDSGAMRRYKQIITVSKLPYIFFEKDRDWVTREVRSISMRTSDTSLSLQGRSVLVIDDIVAEGNTLVKLYPYLKEAKSCCVYCSHLEPTAFRNDALWKNYERIYTTNSIKRPLISQVSTYDILKDIIKWDGVSTPRYTAFAEIITN